MRLFHQLLLALACCLPGLSAQEADPAAEWIGKASFGRYHVKYDKKSQKRREYVEIRVPVRLADKAGLAAEDISVQLTVYNLTDNLDIVPAKDSPVLTWPAGHSAWNTKEVRLILTYMAPPATPEEEQAGIKHIYYGFCAKLLYRGHMLSCIASSPDLFPDKGAHGHATEPTASPTEEAVIFSDFLQNTPTKQPPPQKRQ